MEIDLQEARSAKKTGHMRYVLGISLALAVVALIVVGLFF